MKESNHSHSIKSTPDDVSMNLILLILVTATSASIMSSDMYTPSLPHLPALLNTTPAMVKLTMSLNLIAFGFAQLFHGPLSDRIGRRPVFLLGMIGLSVLSIACAASQTIQQLIGARIFQGIFASVEMVLGMAIIYDIFDEADRVRAMAVFGIAVSITAAVAPLIGGYVHVLAGWRANFFIIAFVAAMGSALAFRLLPESTVPDRHAMQFVEILKDYGSLLINWNYMSNLLVVSAAFGIFLSFVTAGPFILISYLGIATQQYGFYYGLIVVFYSLGSMLAKQRVGKVETTRLLRWGVIAMACGAGTLLVVIFSGIESVLKIVGSMCVTGFGIGLVYAVAPMQALSATAGRTGVASAMLGASQMIMSGLAVAGISLLHDGTSRPLAWTILVMLFISCVAYWGSSSHARNPLLSQE